MILSEADVATRLKSFMGSKIAAAKDRVLAAAGSGEATGRLNMNAATQKLMTTWAQYCGEEKKAGNQIDKHDPNAVDIINFLRAKFNVNIPAEQIAAITGQPAPEVKAELAQSDAENPTDDDGTKDVVLKSEEQVKAELDQQLADREPEVAAAQAEFKNRGVDFENDQIAANPNRTPKDASELKARIRSDLTGGGASKEQLQKFDQDRAALDSARKDESVEQLDEAPAPVRQMFSKLALAMYRAGLITIERKGVTYGGVDAGGQKLPGGTEENAINNDASIDDNGNYINAKLLRQRLMSGDPRVTGEDFNELARGLRASQSPIAGIRFYKDAEPEQKKIMLKIAGDALMSIVQTEQSKTAGENVTTSGNTIDFAVFKSELSKYEFNPKMFVILKDTLLRSTRDGVIDDTELAALVNDSTRDESRAMVGLMAATVLSVKSVEGAKPEAQ